MPSFHLADDPTVRLAPLYDVLSTIALELTTASGRGLTADTRMGQRIGHQADVRLVRAAGLVDEAATWGIRRAVATATVMQMLDLVITSCSAIPGDRRVLETIRRLAQAVAGRSG